MAPTILRQGPFRLFFFLERKGASTVMSHTSVAKPSSGSSRALRSPLRSGSAIGRCGRRGTIVEEHLQEVLDAWHRHFGS